jgi:putative phosphonate transport system ATP-binding protein
MSDKPVIDVKHLYKQFGEGCSYCRNKENKLAGNYCPVCSTVYACRDISFKVYPGEILGIVGESGSGKSSLMKCLYFDLPSSGGEVFLSAYEKGSINVLNESNQIKKKLRDYIFGMIYQNPYDGLRMNISSVGNIAEKCLAAGIMSIKDILSISEGLLKKVSIPKERMREIPKKFSGGMQQRVQIAKALSNNPPILLLDEITTGLDLSVQADVLDLIKEIQRESKVSMIVVSHDLSVIRMLADRTLVMLHGEVVESGLTDQILEDPQHAYTQQLIYSLL